MPRTIEGRARGLLPVRPYQDRDRAGRDLFVTHEDLIIDGQLIPRGYVTDFGSIPIIATIITFILQVLTFGVIKMIKPLGRHAWAALAHDLAYAIGEPGRRHAADRRFLERMKIDGVPAHRRQIMYWSVRLGGWIGYIQAKSWWGTQNFADPDTGEPTSPPFAREEAFVGRPYGLPT